MLWLGLCKGRGKQVPPPPGGLGCRARKVVAGNQVVPNPSCSVLTPLMIWSTIFNQTEIQKGWFDVWIGFPVPHLTSCPTRGPRSKPPNHLKKRFFPRGLGQHWLRHCVTCLSLLQPAAPCKSGWRAAAVRSHLWLSAARPVLLFRDPAFLHPSYGHPLPAVPLIGRWWLPNTSFRISMGDSNCTSKRLNDHVLTNHWEVAIIFKPKNNQYYFESLEDMSS